MASSPVDKFGRRVLYTGAKLGRSLAWLISLKLNTIEWWYQWCPACCRDPHVTAITPFWVALWEFKTPMTYIRTSSLLVVPCYLKSVCQFEAHIRRKNDYFAPAWKLECIRRECHSSNDLDSIIVCGFIHLHLCLNSHVLSGGRSGVHLWRSRNISRTISNNLW